jgi:predicted membrane protein
MVQNNREPSNGAATFSITALSIVTLIINDTQHKNSELSAIMLNVIMLSVVMLIVFMLIVVMLTVVAPFYLFVWLACQTGGAKEKK